MQMNWTDLLSPHRVSVAGNEAKLSKEDLYRTPFEADYDRVVYCAPFRRLARKTQVHPLAANDHVHNRLTHSIEVASVGRSFARRLGKMLLKRNDIERHQIDDLAQIVQAACLAHDIGNPPFGHAGEFAIREWVRVHDEEMFHDDTEPGVCADWSMFEGNAQGFRLAARDDNAQTGYMRLTFATLGAMIKYPWDSQDPRASIKAKFNVFSTEKDIFRLIAEQMGLEREDASVAKHPLSFLTEAADDICYRILDLEDAVDMAILNEQTVRKVFLDVLDKSESPLPLAVLRGQVIGKLVEQCWHVFEQDYDAIMAGTRDDDLKSDLDEKTTQPLEQIKKLYNTIFANRTKVATELGAYETLGRIIETLIQAVDVLTTKGDYKKTDFLTQRRLEFAWGAAYATEHQNQPYNWWLHQVMDYVAGLTDNYARQLAREIAGV